MRSARLGLVLALALVPVFAAHARAVTLSSPVLQSIGGNLTCTVSNVGTTPVKFSVTLHSRQDGNVLAPELDDCAVFFGVLPEGQTCEVALTPPAAARCTVEASSSKVRAVLWVLNSGEASSPIPLTRK
jgi:hypothetical protein